MKRTTLTSLLALILAITFTACSSDNDSEETITLNKTSLSLYHGDSQQLVATGSSNITWTSSNEYVATVSTTGLVTAKFVGTAIIKANGIACRVTVQPKYNLFDMPILTWGLSKSALKAKIGVPYDSIDGNYYYGMDNPKAPTLIYIFSNNKLAGSTVLVKTEYASVARQQIEERYYLTSLSNDSIEMFSDAPTLNEATTIFYLKAGTDGYIRANFFNRSFYLQN